MAYSATGWDGQAIRPLPSVGHFIPMVAMKVTISGTTTSEAITIPQLTTIKGVIVQVLDSGNNVATTDADITWSGNVLTIADGSTFNLDAAGHAIYILAWGLAKL